MQFVQSAQEDLALIFEFYDLAIAHQKKVYTRHWLPFDPLMVKAEIGEGRQWQLKIDDRTAAVYATAFSDPVIWKEEHPAKAIYLHRIVTHPDFRGQNLVQLITNWAVDFARAQDLDFVRLDTWADNNKLLQHYTSCGFKHVGEVSPESEGLPPHYAGITLNLFEIRL
ncbi:N-acetyltransferase [Pedobacter sp. SYP-B3415]|uniref:GNAT family N-acetyltransferase n=1 Tax=Pedobacter sp. SYP-B3415 TaxID=2496641 RepID=UPI00101C99BE|nr:GNAT family N-acetyltransferase [Pedobacter sp. SYP-B3415]